MGRAAAAPRTIEEPEPPKRANAWIPAWFQGNGFTAADSVNLQTWNNVGAILSNVTVGFVSDAIGRKRALWIGWVACIVAIILCSVCVPMFPGVKDTIIRLHASGRLVTIASSRLRGSLTAFVDEMGLAPYIPYILSVSDVERAKPAPDMVLKTLEEYRLSPCEAVVVGDTSFDIRMAHAAGVKAVGVTYGNGSRESLAEARADWLIDGFSELETIV